MSTEQKKPADYTMRDGTPWWKFETMMPPSMDAPILLMNHESGAITPHKDGRYLYDEKDLWTPMPPEAPKTTPSLPASPELPESVRQAIRDTIYFRSKRIAGEPQNDRAMHQFEIEEADEMIAALAPPWPSAPVKDARVCHADGDKCHGCDHYHGKADKCRYHPDRLTPSPVAGLPTPETDEAVNISSDPEDEYVLSEFARSLERRLIAARAEVEAAKNLALNRGQTINQLIDEAEALRAQLAAARAAAADMEEQVKAFEADRASLRAQLTDARAEVERLSNHLFWLRNKVMTAAGPAQAKSACEVQMTQGTISELHAALTEARAQLATAKEEVAHVLSDWNELVKASGSPTNGGAVAHVQSLRSDLAKANAAVEEAKRRLEDEDRAHGVTIDQRDRAEDAANKLASAILVEPIDWPDHDAKWQEALDEVSSVAEVANLRAQLAAQQSVPPEARAVEAAEKLHPEFSRSWIEQLESGDNNGASPARMEEYREMFRKAQAERDRIAAIIQRTCFPPGEGEEWATKTAELIKDTYHVAAYGSGSTISTQTLASLLKHAPARPTAAREDGSLKKAADAFRQIIGFVDPNSSVHATATIGLRALDGLGVSEDTKK